MIDIDNEPIYPNDEDFIYPCACTDCRCEELVEKPDSVCLPCSFGSHAEGTE